ncbi:hypothetical protein TRIUR3_27207 [Triticum urartu]|uniref:Uncharacterized protein n=1 Tax=Triticum urartu TaxID=4572 RepID=M7ZE39_TRIUA|nr:hypothetical protein TRIUR3_27207 [Triticum urartu]
MAQREKSSVAVASLSSSAPTAVPSGERWGAAIGNLGELGANVESLQKLLARKAVFVDDDVFSKASLASEQARSIKILDQRVQSLERELDAAISAAARARTEKRQAEAAQRAAELHAQEVTKELENTARVFQLHMEELRAKQEEIAKRDSDIKWMCYAFLGTKEVAMEKLEARDKPSQKWSKECNKWSRRKATVSGHPVKAWISGASKQRTFGRNRRPVTPIERPDIRRIPRNPARRV